MQHIDQPNIRVVIPDNGTLNGGRQRLSQALPVDKALQYSPMTSVPVFGLDTIMRPSIGQISFANFPCVYDQRKTGYVVDMLDNETQLEYNNSAKLETTRQHLRRLLDGDQLTEFKFKLPLRSSSTRRDRPSPRTESSIRANLGPFAKTVLDSTDIAYSYPSPSTPGPKKTTISKSLPTPISAEKPAENKPSKSTIDSSAEKTWKPLVVVPQLPQSSHFNEYTGAPASKRRKLSPEEEDRLAELRTRDQKQESDAALATLQEFFHQIFEAEDEVENHSTNCSIFIHSTKALSSETHSHLHKAIHKVIEYGRLQDIPVDYLLRIQKLCEIPMIFTQSSDITLEYFLGDADKLDEIQNTLLATCTLLYTMSGLMGDNELYPEDLIQLIPNILNITLDNCIIPVVESRPTDKDSSIYNFAIANKKPISIMVRQMKKILTLFAKVLLNVDITENIITTTEFLSTKLIFVENAPNDKDSALGFQKFEAVRHAAMDLLAKIFAKHPEQRSFILDEILVSLEKLPSTSKNARQFKLIDGKNIQLLSALVMQLVQTAVPQNSSKHRLNRRRLKMSEAYEGVENADDDNFSNNDSSGEEAQNYLLRLASEVDPLYNNAVHSAQYVTTFIVQRAMTSTKTGDQPYRNLLDLFTEDLISVLGLTDWPAAELLLRILAMHMIRIISEHDKSSANAKNMALELLGWMVSAISYLSSTTQHVISSLEKDDNGLTDDICRFFEDTMCRSLHMQDLVGEHGLFHVVVEFLQQRSVGSWQLSNAVLYSLTVWAKQFCNVYCDPEGAEFSRPCDGFAPKLLKMLSDPKWLESNRAFSHIPDQQARAAYLIIILNMDFCKAFDVIVKVLLNSITSDQAKIRNRSLKSVIQMLEKDPALLDRDKSVMDLILRCVSDSSPMVRDSAVLLIAKCMTLRPILEEQGCRAILLCSSDPTVGVRKRCIGLLKDVYVKTSHESLRISIAENLLHRIPDNESSVATLAKQVLEEILLSPFYESIDTSAESPQIRVSLGKLINLIVGAIAMDESVASRLESFLKSILKDSSKGVSQSFLVCKAIVAAMFDRVIDSDSQDKLNSRALFSSMTVFARANPKLFTPDQLETLHPYVGNLATTDDLLLFRSAIIIYRCVLPNISNSHSTLLRDVQNDLFKAIPKLARTELSEVMACLWMMNSVLKTSERLVKLALSVLRGIDSIKSTDFRDPSKAVALGKARSYVRIGGCIGQHYNLEKYKDIFVSNFPQTKSGSVAGMLTDYIAPFTLAPNPSELRAMALESLGGICQTFPAQFSREKPKLAFVTVFKESDVKLKNIVLRTFLDFFSIHEGRVEKLVQVGDSNAAPEDNTRLGGSLKANEDDGAAALIAQGFLHEMLRAAVSKEAYYAGTAIELIASINRQGLIHPKECAGVLVSLETSPNLSVAKVAFDTHVMLHLQHESMFDREYMRAVQSAFDYQYDVVGDSHGARYRPFVAKLSPLFEIINMGSSKYQKKFIVNLCNKVDFDLRKLDTSTCPPKHLLLARFICENLAFFEYGQVSELLVTLSSIERIISTTGSAVTQEIESNSLSASMDIADGGSVSDTVQVEIPMLPSTAEPTVELNIIKPLATASGILMMMWETRSYLRRLYGMDFHARKKEGKPNAKDINRAPTKAHGVTGDRFWDTCSRLMTCVDHKEAMIDICRQFSRLLAIDDELKIGSDDDLNGSDGLLEADDPVNVNGATIIRPTKRKGSASTSGGSPKKAKPRKNGMRKESVDPDGL